LDPLEIVELAVDHDVKAVVLAGNRLISGRQVDDAQPRMAQAHATVGGQPGTLAVRTAVRQPPGRPLQLIPTDGASGRIHPHDAAHRNSLPNWPPSCAPGKFFPGCNSLPSLGFCRSRPRDRPESLQTSGIL